MGVLFFCFYISGDFKATGGWSEEDFHYILTDLGEMEETFPFFGVPLSSRKVRGTFFYKAEEKSTVLTITTLLVSNVFDVGGTVAIPQKCRLTQIGK